MKKIIAAVSALTMLISTQIPASAENYKYNEYEDYYYVDSKKETSSEENPLNNDMFEIKAEVQSNTEVDTFETFELEHSEDLSKWRVIRKTLGYDGVVATEVLSDFLDYREAEKIMNEHNGWSEYVANGYQYDDGLVITDYDTRKAQYAYNDVNGVYYIFSDPEQQGRDLNYNLGLMQETWREQTYLPGQDYPEWGVGDTYIYTIFSDDVNYVFPKTEISNFDDNGYAIMKYEDKQYVIKLKRGYIPTVFYNSEKIKFDQIPVIENGRTLVPLRAIFEKIGADVDWNGDTQTVMATKDGITVSLTINNTTAYKNGEAITLDVPATIINGRTLVPVRFISDCFGVDVDWDGIMQRVMLTSK